MKQIAWRAATKDPGGDPPLRRTDEWMHALLGPGYHQYGGGEFWKPAVNLYEDRNHYCAVVDLAGVQPEEIELFVERGVLVLRGHREPPGMPDIQGPKRVHLLEIDHGPFQRKVQLPANVDIEEIQATYKSGYLWVRLPKTV